MNTNEIDPILTPAEMCRDAKISPATWRRTWRDRLPMIHLSARRVGCRQSVWRAALEGGAARQAPPSNS